MSLNESRKPIATRQRIVELKSHSKVPTRTRASTPSPSQTPVNGTAPLKVENEQNEKDSDVYLQHLIRKLLYPSLHTTNFSDVLPALTSSSKVDIQLYPLVGLLFRSFIFKWYNNITSNREFTDELILVISHITRNIEYRLSKIDVVNLILDDIPLLLHFHLDTYRKVHTELGSSLLPIDTIDRAVDYLQNHTALTDDLNDELKYFRVLTDSILDELLDQNEAKSDLVRSFLKYLISDLLLINITQKLSQPYQIFEILTLVCEKLLQDGGKKEETTSYNKAHSIISTLSHMVALTTSINHSETFNETNVSSLHIFPLLNNLFQIDAQRPVLFGILKYGQVLLSKVNHLVANVLQNTLVKIAKSESLYANIIKILRNNLFPTDENMGPARIEPTMEEFEIIRHNLKSSLLLVCQKYNILFGILITRDSNELENSIENFLTSMEHKRVNQHLVFRLLDLISLRLFPELCSD